MRTDSLSVFHALLYLTPCDTIRILIAPPMPGIQHAVNIGHSKARSSNYFEICKTRDNNNSGNTIMRNESHVAYVPF